MKPANKTLPTTETKPATIKLSPDHEKRLREKAEQAGTTLCDVTRVILEKALADLDDGAYAIVPATVDDQKR